MAVDWTDQERSDRIRAYVVQPTNLDRTRYELGGVELSGSKVSADYYSDTRCSASIKLDTGTMGQFGSLGRTWDRNGFIRIVHEVPAKGYSRELGTFLVSKEPATLSDGTLRRTLDLQSALYALKSDRLKSPLTVAKGASWLDAAHSLLRSVSRPYVDRGASHRRCGDTTVYETGKTVLEVLHSICGWGGIRADVDGHGRVTLSNYTMPINKADSFKLDMTSKSGIVHDGVSFESDWLGRPSDAVVNTTWTETVQKANKRKGQEHIEERRELIGRSSLKSGHASRAVRGYGVVYYEHMSDEAWRDQAKLDKRAKDRLSEQSWEETEWKVTTQHLPIWEGDVGRLVLPKDMAALYDNGAGERGYGTSVRVLVKSIDIDLETMQQDLTLRLVTWRDYAGLI